MRFASLLLLVLLVLPSAALAAVVNINTATGPALETLKGIGPSKAQAVIEYRTAHGPFTSIEDITKVKGIGPSTYANIKASITVGDTGEAVTPAPAAPQPAAKPSVVSPQPSAAPASYKKTPAAIQVLTSTSSDTESHAEEVLAPRTTVEPAALGAAAAAPREAGAGSLFRSPWALAGFLTVLALAGGAFILL